MMLLEGVGMDYTVDGRALAVLDGIDLEVRRGELVCLVGPSGCGKSTLLQILGGFVTPRRGRVLCDGAPVRGPDRRRILVFQERGVFPWLTVADNIAFGLERLSAAERRRVVAEHVRLVGLAGFERAYPDELSGGMKQRVELARALAVAPDALLLDEPFGALDAITRATMRDELLRIWHAAGVTIVLVTHDVDEALLLADRVVVLSPRPATVRRVLDVALPRPRDLGAPGYLALRAAIFDALGR